MPKPRPFKQVLLWLVAGSRGGVNRGKIIEAVKRKPLNANQLSNDLGVEYKTIRHHLDVLEENNVVTSLGDHYGKVYFLSQEMEQGYEDFGEIWGEIMKTLNSSREEGRGDE